MMKEPKLCIYVNLPTVLALVLGLCIPVSTMVPPRASAAAASAIIDARSVSPANRTECPETAEKPRPSNRVNTTSIVEALRAAMNDTALTGGEALDAYITLISDDHGTSGSAYDQRVTYISGFTGSNGYTIVTQSASALWTDGRYFLQAEHQLECFWTLMKISTLGYPTGPAWLADVLPENARVGAFPNYVSIDTWKSYEAAFKEKNITMVSVSKDLVDIVWDDAEPTTRPNQPMNPLMVHALEFTGKTTAEKLVYVRRKLTDARTECLVVTVLEESAWLFNLRGTDRTDSLFYGYSIIFTDLRPSQLFIYNVSRVLADASLRAHLNLTADNACVADVPPGDCVQLREYSTIETYIRDDMTSVTKMWLDPTASYAIYSAIGENRIHPMVQSPILLMKAIKNKVERVKFFECILRDSAAVVEFMASFEPQIQRNVHWTEMSASVELQRIRSTYDNYMGVSFDTISASGPNAAVIHYRPTNETDRRITTSEVYLLDSGGQYKDGTTDVTRTFHFGKPTDMEREAYTRVLMGAIDLALTVWPFGHYGRDIDARARTPLWQHGWDYNHGTGHGIGYFLSVHEGPGRINLGYDPAHAPLYEGMFFSDEPGYYEDGSFGIRLETLVGVVEANTPHHFNGKQYLTFKPATLVPFEPNMIKYELLSRPQIEWLDAFHARCEEETGAYLLNVRKNQTAYEWLVERTKPVSEISGATIVTSSATGIISMVSILSIIVTFN